MAPLNPNMPSSPSTTARIGTIPPFSHMYPLLTSNRPPNTRPIMLPQPRTATHHLHNNTASHLLHLLRGLGNNVTATVHPSTLGPLPLKIMPRSSANILMDINHCLPRLHLPLRRDQHIHRQPRRRHHLPLGERRLHRTTLAGLIHPIGNHYLKTSKHFLIAHLPRTTNCLHCHRCSPRMVELVLPVRRRGLPP